MTKFTLKNHKVYLLFLITLLINTSFRFLGNEKRVALIVGNSNYKDFPLNNPANDAKKMKETLEFAGFEVTVVLNTSQKNLKTAIANFGNKLSNQKNTVGLFYYAGHGIQANGKNYLVPVDAVINTEADYEINCVNIEVLNDYIERASNQMNIIILDACRNNPFAKKNRSFGTANGSGLAAFNAPSGTMIAFATSPGKVAADGSADNGLYTQELIKAIKIPNIKIEDVFKRVRIQVKKLSQDEQIPWENSSITGDFYFMESRTATVENTKPNEPVVPTVKEESNNELRNQGSVFISGSTFKMGAINRPYNEFPIHTVRVDDFWISKYEVTVKEWKKYCKAVNKEMPVPIGIEFENVNITDYWNSKENNPITNISWTEAVEYANWYSRQMGVSEVYKISDGAVDWNKSANGYRLPTEAEWELAARGGVKANNLPFAGSNVEVEVGWGNTNSDDKTHPVGSKKPNEANLFDMTGNVWEWCFDWYDEYYYKNSEKENPVGIISGTMKSIRGGSWLSSDNRVTIRKGKTTKTKSTEIGFRLAHNN